MTTRVSLLLALVAATALAAVAACVSDRQTTGPSQTVGNCQLPLDSASLGATVTPVAIQNFAFVPSEIHVRAGTTVTWINCETDSTLAHTSTSDAGVWSSDLLLPGQQTFSFTFTQVGTFPYHCIPHPFMTAAVVVEP
jgi:plastocyanin